VWGCEGDLLADGCGQPCPQVDLVVWLDASDGANLKGEEDSGGPLSEGTLVARWLDRSGSGNDAVSLYETNRPSLAWEGTASNPGFGGVRFAGAVMEISELDLRYEQVEAVTSFAVVLHSNPDGGRVLWAQTQNGFTKREHVTPGARTIRPVLSVMSTSTGENETRYWTNHLEEPLNNNWEPLTPGGKGIALGALLFPALGSEGHYHSEFILGELLIYRRTLSSVERRQVESYLSGKWNIKLEDRFHYRIVDTSGLEGEGEVHLSID